MPIESREMGKTDENQETMQTDPHKKNRIRQDGWLAVDTVEMF